jgi:hypothetical protein
LASILDDYGVVKSLVHNKIFTLASKVANEIDLGKIPERTLDFEIDVEADPLCDTFNDIRLENDENSIGNSFNAIRLEFEIYLRRGPQGRKAQDKILDWWKNHQRKFPIFSVVARILLPTEASSAAIELDLEVSRQYLDNQKLSLSTENVEMKSFINRNMSFLDWNKIVLLERESY